MLGLGAVVAIHEVAEIVVIGNGLGARRNIYGNDHDHASHAPPALARDDAVTDHTHSTVG